MLVSKVLSHWSLFVGIPMLAMNSLLSGGGGDSALL